MRISYLKYFYILLIVFILSMLGSFAYFSWGSDTDSNTNVSFDVVAETVYIEYDAGSDIEGANLYPVDDKSDGISKDITVKTDKVSSKPVTFNLYLDLTDVPEKLMDNSFKWAIYRDNELIASDSITKNMVECSKNNTNHIVLVSNETVDTTLRKYTLYLWIDGNMTNPDTMMNKSFKVKLHADGENAIINDLFNVMKKQAVLDNKKSTYVSSSSGIDFSKISSDTNGKGVYIRSGTENDTYPVYYYRGAVDNNNVLFANFCWKIVRTTETGGVKLIYNGVPSNGTCNNTGDSASIGTSAFNTKSNSPAYVGYMYGVVYEISVKIMSDITDIYYYGNDVTYEDGTYTLTNTITSNSWSSIYNTSDGIYNHHYSCFSTSNTCSNVYYIYYTTSSYAHYLTLTDGNKVEDALSEMLDYNTNNSTIKTVIDNWYSENMTNYTNKLEDAIWCNDRSIGTLNGWTSNDGNSTGYLWFSARNRAYSTYSPSLTCSRDIDKFTTSISNGNGNLTYPVGLLTADEIVLAGGRSRLSNDSYYLYTGSFWWVGSPDDFFSNSAYGFIVHSGGQLNYNYNNASTPGVRPCISLASGVEITGSGTVNDPYVVN